MANDTTRDNRGQPKNCGEDARLAEGSEKARSALAAADDAGNAGGRRLAAADHHRQDAVVPLGSQTGHRRSQRQRHGQLGVARLAVAHRGPRHRGEGHKRQDRCSRSARSSGDRRLGAILFNYSNLGKFTLRRHKTVGRHARRRHQRRGHAGEIPRAERQTVLDQDRAGDRNRRRRRVGHRRTDRAGLASAEVVGEVRHGRRRRRRDERRGGHRSARRPRHGQAHAPA